MSRKWKSKSRKPDQKDRPSGRTERDKARVQDRDRCDPLNDFSWYNKYPSLIESVAKIPFPNRPGMQVQTLTNAYMTGNSTAHDMSVPGFLSLDWVPTLGYSQTATDPASIVGKEIYSRVRKVYSGALDADAPDFVIYLAALDSVFAFIAYCKRIYRISGVYTPENMLFPEVALRAVTPMNTDPTPVFSKRQELFSIINQLVYMSRKFTCPDIMDLFRRHYWMSDNVYTDADSPRAQMYAFRPKQLFKYSVQKSPNDVDVPGLALVNVPISVDPQTLFTFGRSLIDALVAWDDAYTISGYLARAYDGTASFVVDELAMDEVFAPVYVPEVLMQIENSRTIALNGGNSAQGTGVSANVSQDPITNAVLSYPFVISQTVSHPPILDFLPYLSIRSDSPTVADVTVASRLHSAVIPAASGDNKHGYGRVVCATEIPIQWWYVAYLPSYSGSSSGIVQYGMAQAKVITPTASMGGNDLGMILATLPAFDWHPMMQFIVQTGSADSVTNQFGIPAGDIHNFTTFSVEQLEKIHTMCLYSELNAFEA